MDKISAADLLLVDDEVALLRKGLMEWGGPAKPTEEFAIAMGFGSAAELPEECLRIRAALVGGEPIAPLDWARAQLATEIAFVSDVVGSGYEWATTTGWSDAETLRTLRSLQRKLVRTVAPLIGHALGSRPPIA